MRSIERSSVAKEKHRNERMRVPEQSGFLLMYTLVVLAAVLGVSAVLATVAVRHLQVVRGAYESMRANYAAEAGAECALYWRIRNGRDGAYRCGDNGANGSFVAQGTTRFVAQYLNQGGSCVAEANVEVDDANRVIRSRGYNRCNPTANLSGVVERGYMIRY